ncbi:hypothetical protein FACS189472_11070 [Alphaproteobacteria bacterium]|nr:hypothetical protein FACS189472_11070 [Alphaproteobacteria bacterium]
MNNQEDTVKAFKEISSALTSTATLLKSFEERLNKLESSHIILRPTSEYKNDRFNYNPYNNVMKRDKIIECLLRLGASYKDLERMTKYKDCLQLKLKQMNYAGNFNFLEVSVFLDKNNLPQMNQDMKEAQQNILIICEQRHEEYERSRNNTTGDIYKNKLQLPTEDL